MIASEQKVRSHLIVGLIVRYVFRYSWMQWFQTVSQMLSLYFSASFLLLWPNSQLGLLLDSRSAPPTEAPDLRFQKGSILVPSEEC